jgi:hypothetical protein
VAKKKPEIFYGQKESLRFFMARKEFTLKLLLGHPSRCVQYLFDSKRVKIYHNAKKICIVL